MSSYNELVSILKELLLNRFYPMPYYMSALLGDGNGNVLVPNRPDYNYVRFNRASSETFEVFNKEVSQPVDGWPVKIGEFPWQPGLIQVVGTDWSAYSQTGWGDSVASIQAHAPTHEWPTFAPGSDPLNVYPRSLTQLRAQSVGSGSNSIYVTAYEYDWTGTSQIWPGVPPLDFSAKPPTGSMLYMGVYLNPGTNSLGVVSGSTTVYTDALEPPLPAWPLGVYPSGYVRLYGGQAGVGERDIRPAQRLYNSTLMFTGTSGGGWPFANVLTVSTTDADADYDNVTDAIAAASAGDAILLDMESSSETVTVNKAITLIGWARAGTVFTNTMTVSAAATLINIKVSIASGVNPKGFVISASTNLINCEAVTAGTSTSRAIEQSAGNSQVIGGYYESNGAGTNHEVFVSGGSMVLVDPILSGASYSGNIAGTFRSNTGNVTNLSSLTVLGNIITGSSTLLSLADGTTISEGVWLVDVSGGVRKKYADLPTAAAAAAAGDIILLGPGTYTLTAQLAYGAAFTIQGSGPERTTINCATNSVSLLLLNSAGAALRNLTITHSGAGVLNSGVYITANATIENVTVTLSGVATANYAILQQGGTATLTNVNATASGATTNHGYRNDTGDATVTLSGGRFSGTQQDIYGERTGSTLDLVGAVLANNLISYTGNIDGFYQDGSGNFRQVASDNDVYVTDQSAGLARRLIPGWLSFGFANVEDEFEGSSLGAAWAWAGAPFITPSGITVGSSLLRIAHNVSTQRAFLVRTDNITGITVHGGVVSFLSPIDSAYIGVRLDDGDDSDYAEVAVRKTSATRTWEIITKVRTGSGAVTTTVRHTTDFIPNLFAVGIQIIGTQWTNWGWSVQFAPFGSPVVDAINVVASGLTWTPTRRGFVYENAATTDTFRTAIADKAIRT